MDALFFESISHNFFMARTGLGFTSKELARLANVSQQTVMLLETDPSGVKFSTVWKVQTALNLPMELLVRNTAYIVDVRYACPFTPEEITKFTVAYLTTPRARARGLLVKDMVHYGMAQLKISKHAALLALIYEYHFKTGGRGVWTHA
jgi:transcriptional regulator with XRE-family HTH domain